ncbi:MAG: ATP-binding protein [Deltaproteobacteria bacterium]|nr:ATP-binding protein [Deltaproteobacteria bacterium]
MNPELLELSRLFLRKYSRTFIRYFLKEHELSHRMNVVVGQRGVGKTTAAVQHLLSKVDGDMLSRKILYVPSDHFLLRGVTLYEIAKDFFQTGGQVICFDEVHKYPGWSGELKSIHDTFADLEILATGSSALEVFQGSHDLSRRAIVHIMHGMSLREFIALDSDISLETAPLVGVLKDHERLAEAYVRRLEEHGIKILEVFGRYLRHGYYPYFRDLGNEDDFFTLLEQNVHTAVEVDLLAVSPNLSGESIRKLKRLLAVVAGAVPFVPNFRTLGAAVGVVDQRTIRNYLEQLQRVGVLRLLPKAGRPHDSLAKPEKIYLDNSNQQLALTSLGSANLGTVRETFFASQLGAHHRIGIPKKGDFLVDDSILFEVGGKNKKNKQIRDENHAFRALDNIEIGSGNRVPLWLFGFSY